MSSHPHHRKSFSCGACLLGSGAGGGNTESRSKPAHSGSIRCDPAKSGALRSAVRRTALSCPAAGRRRRRRRLDVRVGAVGERTTEHQSGLVLLGEVHLGAPVGDVLHARVELEQHKHLPATDGSTASAELGSWGEQEAEEGSVYRSAAKRSTLQQRLTDLGKSRDLRSSRDRNH